jgi:acyl-CoA synthetase (NDP forming)
MADHSEATLKRLREISASWVALSNPVDMSPIAATLGPGRGYREVIELLLRDDGVDAVVAIPLAPTHMPMEEYSFFPELSSQYPHKPLYVSFTGDKHSIDQARAFLESRSIPVFIPLEDALETLRVLGRCREAMSRGNLPVESPESLSDPEDNG